MTFAYLVDTDWAIHWLHSNERIQQRVEDLRRQGLALSAVSLAELWEGVHYSRNPQESEHQLYDFLGAFPLSASMRKHAGSLGKSEVACAQTESASATSTC